MRGTRSSYTSEPDAQQRGDFRSLRRKVGGVRGRLLRLGLPSPGPGARLDGHRLSEISLIDILVVPVEMAEALSRRASRPEGPNYIQAGLMWQTDNRPPWPSPVAARWPVPRHHSNLDGISLLLRIVSTLFEKCRAPPRPKFTSPITDHRLINRKLI